MEDKKKTKKHLTQELTRLRQVKNDNNAGRREVERAPSDKVTEHMSIFRDVMQMGKNYVELELRKKDGTSVPVDLNVVILPNDMIYGSCRDITERKKAEEALKKSHERLAEAQQLAHLGSYEFEISQGEVHWSNETFRITGKGTGLGLAVCQRIMENHKGTLRVESEPGKGTTMIGRLPF